MPFTTKGFDPPPPHLVVPRTIYILGPFFGDTESMIAKKKLHLAPLKNLYVLSCYNGLLFP